MNVAITFDQVSLAWGNKIILHDFSGKIMRGSMTAVLGPNGAGKSTLMKAIVGTCKPTRGSIRIASELTPCALLTQRSEIDRHFPITVYDLVAMGAWSKLRPWQRYPAQMRQAIQDALDRVGLVSESHELIEQLSGGQLQRALFARMMLSDSQVILLDEPFAGIDADTAKDLMALIHQWHKQGRTIIAVLHDIELAKKEFSQALLLARGIVDWGGTKEVLSSSKWQQAREKMIGGWE